PLAEHNGAKAPSKAHRNGLGLGPHRSELENLKEARNCGRNDDDRHEHARTQNENGPRIFPRPPAQVSHGKSEGSAHDPGHNGKGHAYRQGGAGKYHARFFLSSWSAGTLSDSIE